MARSSNVGDLKSKKFWVALLAEFLGTGLLVTVGCGACAAGSTIPGIALSFGLAVGTIVWAIAHVSGGHINPAVTAAFLVTRKISLVRALFYVAAQSVGALAGAGFLQVVTPHNETWSGPNPTLGTSAPPGDGTVSRFQVLLIEAAITFVLVFTVFATCDSRRKGFNGSGPLAIGLSVTVGHLWAVRFTGAGTNPARVFGPAVVSKTFVHHWAYWVGPLLGGVIAGVLYDFVFAENASKEKLSGFFTADYDDDDYDEGGPRRGEAKDTELSAKTRD